MPLTTFPSHPKPTVFHYSWLQYLHSLSFIFYHRIYDLPLPRTRSLIMVFSWLSFTNNSSITSTPVSALVCVLVRKSFLRRVFFFILFSTHSIDVWFVWDVLLRCAPQKMNCACMPNICVPLLNFNQSQEGVERQLLATCHCQGCKMLSHHYRVHIKCTVGKHMYEIIDWHHRVQTSFSQKINELANI